MKRIVEIVLGIIGELGYGFISTLRAFMLWMQNNRDAMGEVMTGSGNPKTNFAIEELEAMMNVLGADGWGVMASAIAAIVPTIKKQRGRSNAD